MDLGCGYGNDTLYLHEKGYTVISCDLSGEALKRLRNIIDRPMTLQFDMLSGLPFDDGAAKIIIADHSLHYFYRQDTKRGYLLCRVNSVRDKEHGEGEGRQLEEDYYEIRGRQKRFFSRGHLEELFKDCCITHIDKYSLSRFGQEKLLWEAAVRKEAASARCRCKSAFANCCRLQHTHCM